jgi:hypothetical protein
MATQKPFKLNRKAIREIGTSDRMQLMLFVKADKMLQACDPDGHLGEDAYVAVSSKTRSRARAAVIAVTGHAVNSNALHHTLMTALDAARD